MAHWNIEIFGQFAPSARQSFSHFIASTHTKDILSFFAILINSAAFYIQLHK